jgi:hypothetical protein
MLPRINRGSTEDQQRKAAVMYLPAISSAKRWTVVAQERARPHHLQVLAHHVQTLMRCKAAWIGYASTTSVYGDWGGAWVDEMYDPYKYSCQCNQGSLSSMSLCRFVSRCIGTTATVLLQQQGDQLPDKLCKILRHPACDLRKQFAWDYHSSCVLHHAPDLGAEMPAMDPSVGVM